MKNILDILKEAGIEVPEDKVADINKAVAENYKTVAEFDKKVQRLETERDGYKTQLDTANETLEGFKDIDVADIQNKLKEAQEKAENAEKEYQAQLEARDFDDALKTAMGEYKFTSKAAEKSIMTQIKGAGLKCVNGKIMGLNDYITTLKESDADAFVSEDDTEPARFTSSIQTTGGGKKYTSRDEIMKIKNSKERQQAIAENIDLFQ